MLLNYKLNGSFILGWIASSAKTIFLSYRLIQRTFSKILPRRSQSKIYHH
jgi:hypothetical protein